ncbi:hypothetical protein B9G69_009565 [Bdellovibrio sp. SKB1291214]|uniref:hypothetical protein n=1 Tax=Bdellovibrio sp. SKB1291214 TaxID=1732569 RepID=UPI000B517778|nr:hypothetical protein [Bdellovibrio sp. SKB1291214]UYL07292.1 hypothetical protein B9G69_009565 [Bdellovibrio sp. SKB1291214]
MKSLLIALSIFTAVPALAFQVEPYGGNDEPMGDSWCVRNQVMMAIDGEIVPGEDCGTLTCVPSRRWEGYRYRNSAVCMAINAAGAQGTNN